MVFLSSYKIARSIETLLWIQSLSIASVFGCTLTMASGLMIWSFSFLQLSIARLLELPAEGAAREGLSM